MVTVRGARAAVTASLGVRIVEAVENFGTLLELLGTVVVELEGHGPCAGRSARLGANQARGRRLQVRAGNCDGAKDVLDSAGIVTGGVRLVSGTFDALDVSGGRAVEGQEVVQDLLGLPLQGRSILGLLGRSIRENAVAVLVGEAHRDRRVNGGRTQLGLARLRRHCTGLARLGVLTGLRGDLTRLGGSARLGIRRTGVTGLRVGVLDRRVRLSQSHAQHGTEVHL